MRQRGRGRQRGFTFLEFLLVSSLLTLIGGALAEFAAEHIQLQALSQAHGDLRTGGQLAMDQMVTELRHATRAAAGSPPNLTVPAAPNNTSLTFYLPADVDGNGLIVDAAGNIEWATGTPIQYQYNVAAKQLRRVADGNTRVLANDVTGVVFKDRTIDGSLNADEVSIQLTLQRTTPSGRAVSTTVNALVKLRN